MCRSGEEWPGLWEVLHVCMHVCALICERPSIASDRRVQRRTMVRVYVQALGTLCALWGLFVAVGLFCTTPCCLSSCLGFCLGLSILPPPVPLKDHLTWMRLLNHPVMPPCLTHFGCTSTHSYSLGVLPGRVFFAAETLGVSSWL